MSTGNALRDYKRLLNNFTYSSLAESRGEAETPLQESVIVEEARPEYPKMPSAMRKLAGMGDSEFSSWSRDRRPLAESVEGYDLSALVSRFMKLRVINIFETERMSGPLLPAFDWAVSDALIEAAQKQNIHPEVAKSHIKAQMMTNVADKDQHSSAAVAHKAHASAAEAHHMASRMMRQSGDHETANKHDLHAKHHEGAAHHFKALDASHTAKAFGVKKMQAPEKAAEKPAAKKAPFKKHDTVVAPKGATVHWRPEHGNHPEPTKPTKKPEASKEPAKKTDDFKPSKAQNLTYAAHSAAKDKSVSHKELHGMHTKAARAHMADALKHFKSGDHEKAQLSFSHAMHNAGKAKHHNEAGREKTRSAVKAIPAGPRASVGRTAASPNNNPSKHGG